MIIAFVSAREGILLAVFAVAIVSVLFAALEIWLLSITTRRIRQRGAGYTIQPEKHSQPIGPHLQRQQQDLQEIVRKLVDNPDLEQLLLSTLRQRVRTTRLRQLAIATLGNALSIVAGWLLSGLVSPIGVLTTLHLQR